jgi:ribosome-binding factor A
MHRKKPSHRELQSLCADVHPDDGADPRRFSRRAKRPHPDHDARPVHRKTLQLCSQVADTLSQVLSGECGDQVLQGLQLVAVRPAPNAAQLLVLVTSSPTEPALDPAAVLKQLSAASGRLRMEVAGAIVRKRAPKLVFQYLDPNVTRPPG